MKRFILFISGFLFLSHGMLRGEETPQSDQKENTFSMNVQIRPRAEYRNGVLFPRLKGDEATGFIDNRARLSMAYERQNLSIGLSAQHVGVWGQDPQIDKNGRFILNEAWAQLSFGSGFFAKLGRQSLIYDDERILGGLDWNVAGRYHDALKLGYQNPLNKLHLILAFNQNNSERIIGGTYYAPGGQPYKTMQALWYEHTFSPAFRASFLFMNIGIEGDTINHFFGTKNLQTLGTNLYYQSGGWTLGGTFYYQLGKSKTDRDVSAFMWAVNAGYQIDPRWKVSVGSDYLSGAGDDPKGDYKAFDPLYGTHHKFYGAMDYFYASAFVNGTNPGLWDNQLSVAFKPAAKVSLSLAYHYFSITGNVFQANGDKANRGLGSELDFQVDWQIMKDVKLSAGYSTMLAGRTMELVKGGDSSVWQDWGWLSLNINPRVFMAKW